MKLPLRTLGLAIAALFLGSALAPAAAQQQQSGVDGQVAVRSSDGALYLIINGQRRWVATVVASDAEINALPEGEPVYSGLAPIGSNTVSAAKPSTESASSAKPTTSKPTTSKPTSSTSSKPSSSSDNGDEALSSDIPIEISFEGSRTFEPGDSRVIEIRTRKDVTCELWVELPGDDDIREDSKSADSRGRCRYTIEIPDDADEGDGTLIGTVREGGKVNRQEIKIKIEED
jgi:hypothetical protein